MASLLKSKKWLVLIAGAAVLIGGLSGFILFSPWKIIDGATFLGMGKKAAEAKKPEKVVSGHIYKMDPFVVNLRDTERMRYLKLKLEIESSEQKANEEYEKRLPQLRDMILTVLTSKSSNDIRDSQGKTQLRKEMQERLNQLVRSFQIKTIYFSEFIIQ